MKHFALYTPSNSQKPTPDGKPENNIQNDSELQSEQDNENPSSVQTTSGSPFEINLGFITFTDLNLNNPKHISVMFGLISTLVAAYVYKNFMLKYQQYLLDQDAYQDLQQNIIPAIHRLESHGIPTVSFLDYIFNSQRLIQVRQIKSEYFSLRKKLLEFERRYIGKLSPELETALHNLVVAATQEPINVYSMATALNNLLGVAQRLQLDKSTIHYITSLKVQLLN